jgi:mRNA interferase RelE/StbE
MSESVYTVNVTRSAQKEIRALDGIMRVRVVQSIRSLAVEPRPPGCRKLVGAIDRWRIRIGDYRVIYSINDNNRLVEVNAARHRSKAYE